MVNAVEENVPGYPAGVSPALLDAYRAGELRTGDVGYNVLAAQAAYMGYVLPPNPADVGPGGVPTQELSAQVPPAPLPAVTERPPAPPVAVPVPKPYQGGGPTIGDISGGLRGVVSGIAGGVANAVGGVSDALSSVAGSLLDVTRELVSKAIPTVSELALGIARASSNALSFLADNLTDAADLGLQLAHGIMTPLELLAELVGGHLSGTLLELLSALLASFESIIAQRFGAVRLERLL